MAQQQLHEHVTCVAAPATWLSGESGQLVGGADGLYVQDRRAVARLELTVDGAAPAPLDVQRTGAASAVFAGVPRPGLSLTRSRLAEPLGGTETITLANDSDAPSSVVLAVSVATDFATTGAVRDKSTADVPAADGPATDGSNTDGSNTDGSNTDGSRTDGSTVDFQDENGVRWARSPDGMTVRLDSTPPSTMPPPSTTPPPTTTLPASTTPGAPPTTTPGGPLRWAVTLAPGERWTVELRFTRTDIGPIPRAKRFSTLRVSAADPRLDALVRTSVQDLDALRRTEGADVYYSAGSPWYLTLFGRDALWSARLGLPLGVEVAAGTLRALGTRQGTAYDGSTEEEPGRILHEVRPTDAAHRLPPVYYGTVDATALFVCTLADAYRWGMRPDAVAALLSNVEAALEWLAGHEGFVAYRSTGAGLTHQGWKDSGDGVQFADGRVATGTVALCEVQAYAYQAALSGAQLLDAFGRPGGQRWRAWAARLAERFRAAFWCPGGYPAVAVTGAGERVDGLASNMGHLLGTGLLSAAESAAVAGWLQRLRSPFGVRTLGPDSAGYDPSSYHAGSVWPHDTAIALLGLARDGHREEAAALVGALLAAGERFGFRLPELYGGDDDATPYPAACRPQAWAAAAGPAVLTALLGLDVDVPAGRITFDPLRPSPVGAFRVRGLKVADGELDVTVDAAGVVTVHNGPVGIGFLLADGSPARIARPTSAASAG